RRSTMVGGGKSGRQVSLDEGAEPEVYVAAAQTPRNISDVTYVVSTKGAPELLVPSVRDVVRSVAPNQPLYVVKSMEQVISDSLQSRKLTLSLLAIFAILAVLLSAAGVYGVMSY